MRTQRRIVHASVAVVVLALAACSRLALPTGVVASVNGVEIPHEQFERLTNSIFNDPSNPAQEAGSAAERVQSIDDIQRQVLTQLVRNELIRQAATERGVDLSAEVVEQRWQEEISLRGSEESFRDRLDQLGLTEAEAREQLRAAIAQQSLAEQLAADAEVADADVRALYDERLDSQYRRAAVSHILVDTEDEANAILELLDGGASFEELARTRSTDSFSAEQDGSLGSNPRGAFVPAFDDAVWSSDEGVIVGPIETQFGFHLIRVDEFETVEFDEVEAGLREELAQQRASGAFQTFLADVLATAEVEIDPRFGAYDPASGTIVAASPAS